MIDVKLNLSLCVFHVCPFAVCRSWAAREKRARSSWVFNIICVICVSVALEVGNEKIIKTSVKYLSTIVWPVVEVNIECPMFDIRAFLSIKSRAKEIVLENWQSRVQSSQLHV